MDSIIAQIQALAKTSDDAGHLEIKKALADVQLELQGPKDLLYNLANSVSAFAVYLLRAVH
jgi:hypothetical protein